MSERPRIRDIELTDELIAHIRSDLNNMLSPAGFVKACSASQVTNALRTLLRHPFMTTIDYEFHLEKAQHELYLPFRAYRNKERKLMRELDAIVDAADEVRKRILANIDHGISQEDVDALDALREKLRNELQN